ncbi:hypothetical protein SDJN03_07407, partial [Cucurbita argyrosperma subsp. sororia]
MKPSMAALVLAILAASLIVHSSPIKNLHCYSNLFLHHKSTVSSSSSETFSSLPSSSSIRQVPWAPNLPQSPPPPF